jgi:hypothetical protein
MKIKRYYLQAFALSSPIILAKKKIKSIFIENFMHDFDKIGCFCQIRLFLFKRKGDTAACGNY